MQMEMRRSGDTEGVSIDSVRRAVLRKEKGKDVVRVVELPSQPDR